MRIIPPRFSEIAKIFDKKDRLRLIAVVLIQIFLSFLDLLGVAIVGVLGALGVSGIKSDQPGDRVSLVLRTLRLDNFELIGQAIALGLIATLLFVGRTLISILLIRRTFHFLAGRAAQFSTGLARGLFSQLPESLARYQQQELLYATTTGIQNVTLGIVGNSIAAISDFALLIILFTGLLVVDPILAQTAILFFGILGFSLYRLMRHRATRLGTDEMKFGIESNHLIIEYLNSSREAIVKNRREYYIQNISKSRYQLANVLAEKNFLPNVSKYILETAMILGALLIGAIQFSLQDAGHAIASLSIFLASASRIAPAVLRIQQGAVMIRGSYGASILTLDLISEVGMQLSSKNVPKKPDLTYPDFAGEVTLENVEFSYNSNVEHKALTEINLNIKAGSMVAITGPSGAGKSTLVDLILGICDPVQGRVLVSQLKPELVFEKFPGAIAYVPQKISITAGTIRKNVCLGYGEEEFSDQEIWDALDKSYCSNFVRLMPGALDAETGEEGNRLSGGQRQRLGIARALITKPKLLVLDEASSALDAQTEFDLSAAIKSLKGEATVILVAHRLSTVREADQVIYMDNGKILASGNFDEVRKTIPDFDKQAKLMGL